VAESAVGTFTRGKEVLAEAGLLPIVEAHRPTRQVTALPRFDGRRVRTADTRSGNQKDEAEERPLEQPSSFRHEHLPYNAKALMLRTL
jgi:hypothetical protein